MSRLGKLGSEADDQVIKRIFAGLNERNPGMPDIANGDYARAICNLPAGWRAFAATHHLDISLAMDDLGWHFLNYGEEQLARQTEAGLRELGLTELAELFAEAGRIMRPLLPKLEAESAAAGEKYHQVLTAAGQLERINQLSERAWQLIPQDGIYYYWAKYAERHPELELPEKF